VREHQLSSTKTRASFACLRAAFASGSRTRIHQGVFHYSSQNFANANIPSRTLRFSRTRILPSRTRICQKVFDLFLINLRAHELLLASRELQPFLTSF
jgi:hypothetical protein